MIRRFFKKPKKDIISREALQVEIDLQLTDGNISEYYAKNLTREIEEMEESLHRKKENLKHIQNFGPSYPQRDLLKDADPGKEHEDWSRHQSAKERGWRYGMSEKVIEREVQLENPIEYTKILSMLELNKKILDEIKKQIEEGLISEKEANNKVTPYTLIAELSWKWDKNNEEMSGAVERQEGGGELEKILNLAKNYLRMNRERMERIQEQLKNGLIDQAKVEDLMQESPGRAIYQLRTNEIKKWTEEGFIKPNHANNVIKDLTERAEFFRSLEKVKKEMDEARKNDDQAELDKLEEEKKE